MPILREHLAQACHNAAFRASIDPQAYPDWVVMGGFYEAVHLVDAFLAAEGSIHPENHKERKDQLNQIARRLRKPGFRRFYGLYREIEDVREDVCYKCLSIQAEDLQALLCDLEGDLRSWIYDRLRDKNMHGAWPFAP